MSARRVKMPTVVTITIFVAIAFSTIYPIFYVTATALRTDADYRNSPIGLPGSFTLDNVIGAWTDAGLSGYVVNSLVVVISAVILLTILASLAGYAFAHLNLPGSRTLLAIVVGSMIVPPAVIMIPVFKVILEAGLLNSRLGLVLVYASLNLPFTIFLTTTYMRGIPGELFEAARVDGASTLRAFTLIALPLSRPGLATAATLNFLVLWNELLFALVLLPGDESRTVTVGISVIQGQYLTSVPTVAAGLLSSIVPPLLVFAFLQRDLARGLTSGAVK